MTLPERDSAIWNQVILSGAFTWIPYDKLRLQRAFTLSNCALIR